MRTTTRFLVIASLLATAAGCSTAPAPTAQTYEIGASGALHYPGFGDFHRPISTTSTEAQRWFDQGMQLLYGFNHDEAIRAFQEASALDPTSPMPYWGIAYANGININDPAMTEQRSTDAYRAARSAHDRIDSASPVERALIEAVNARYAWPIPEDRAYLDQAYADAMQAAYAKFPQDPDVAALYAESLMNLQPWDYWTTDGEPKGRAAEFVGVLESTLTTHTDHPGANHFYIHAVEASSDAARAVPAAERLTTLVPGSGHLVHMPSHIFIRVGRYADAATTNISAIEADRNYFKLAPEPGFYYIYYGHNLHFLAFASMMSGQYEQAMTAARSLEAEIPDEALKPMAGLIDGIMPSTLHVMIRFGKWEEILEEPEYPEWRLVSVAVRHYARSIALSALDRTYEARQELEAFETAFAAIPEDWWVFNNKISQVLPIARAMINGELLFREGKREEAYAALREGIEWEDNLVYDEPPAWMLPVRHALGALLMSDGKYAEAEQVYRDDLKKNVKNGWALLGLQLALEAQGDHRGAQRYAMEFARAWRNADVQPTSSCYCEPGVVSANR